MSARAARAEILLRFQHTRGIALQSQACPFAELHARCPGSTTAGDARKDVRPMATQKQRETARKNVKKAQSGAREKRTISNLSKQTRPVGQKRRSAFLLI